MRGAIYTHKFWRPARGPVVNLDEYVPEDGLKEARGCWNAVWAAVVLWVVIGGLVFWG